MINAKQLPGILKQRHGGTKRLSSCNVRGIHTNSASGPKATLARGPMVFSRKETSFTPCVNEWIHPRGRVGLAAQHSWIRLEIVDHAVAARFLSAAAMVPAAKVWPAPHPAIGHLGLPFGDHDSQVAVTPWAGAAQIFCHSIPSANYGKGLVAHCCVDQQDIGSRRILPRRASLCRREGS